MELPEALTVLLTVAAGHHPTSGQPLPAEDSAHDPLVHDALFVAVQLLRRVQERAERAPSPHTGRNWTIVEDAALAAAFADNPDIEALAAQFGRSPGAVKTRLLKLGKLSITYRT